MLIKKIHIAGEITRSGSGKVVHSRRVYGLPEGRSILAFLLFLVVFFLFPGHLQTVFGETRYIYDDLGRLSSVIDSDSQVATYLYDPVGNLLAITRSTGGIGAPLIDGITPTSLEAGEERGIRLTGQNLMGARLTVAQPEILTSNIRSKSTEVTATLFIPNPRPSDSVLLTLATDAGTASVTLPIHEPPVTLTRLNPDVALPGDEIILEGRGFSVSPDATQVSFPGKTAPLLVTPLSFPPPTFTRVYVLVPDGVISGDLTVRVGSQTSNPLPF